VIRSLYHILFIRFDAPTQSGLAHVDTFRTFQQFRSQISDIYGCVYGPGKEQKKEE
jgi:hypothetical protein